MEMCGAKIINIPICLDKVWVCVCQCLAKEKDWGQGMETLKYYV